MCSLYYHMRTMGLKGTSLKDRSGWGEWGSGSCIIAVTMVASETVHFLHFLLSPSCWLMTSLGFVEAVHSKRFCVSHRMLGLKKKWWGKMAEYALGLQYSTITDIAFSPSALWLAGPGQMKMQPLSENFIPAIKHSLCPCQHIYWYVYAARIVAETMGVASDIPRRH